MKKVFMGTAFLCALANFAFARGQRWASDERPVYDGESEVVFTYNGLEGVSAMVHQNGTFVGEINTGTSKRLIVADGSHTSMCARASMIPQQNKRLKTQRRQKQ